MTSRHSPAIGGAAVPVVHDRPGTLAAEVTRYLVWDIEATGWQARSTPTRTVKRAVDVVAGFLLLIVTAPLVLLLAVVGALHFRANPFFSQTRVGQDGHDFTIHKLRSLPPQTDAYLLKESLGAVELGWFSRFLRSTKLDELPQLVNVVAGSMSLIGPRPKMPDEFEPVALAYRHARTRVPQGCSCIWQVGVTTAGLPSETPEFDYFYLLHGSLRLDLWIAVRTALHLVRLTRPMTLDDVPRWVRGKGWIEPAAPARDADEDVAA